MAHHHHNHQSSYNRMFAIGVALNLGFVVLEAAFGYTAHSLALVADAGHNLSDVLGLLLAWGASLLAQRTPTSQHTYGWRRASILAALANAIILLIALGAIGWEALRRLTDVQPVVETTVIWVASIGIVINTLTALLFLADRHHDLNIRGAFLHMAADAAISFGVVVAAVLMLVTGWLWLDPIVSLAIGGVILLGTWSLLKESFTLALDAVPPSINAGAIDAYLRALPDVQDVHDMHIWALSTTEVALTAHLVLPSQQNHDALLETVCATLHDQFGIEHSTLQVESQICPSACCLNT